MSFVVPIKIGNLDPVKPWKSIMDLMPIDYQNEVNSIHQKSVYGHLLVNDDLAEWFAEMALKPIRYTEDPEDLDEDDRARQYFLRLNKLEKEVDGLDADLWYNQCLAPGVQVAPIDVRHVTNPNKLFEHSSLLDVSKFKIDKNIHTSGTFTIGPGGGDDFASHVAAAADAGTFNGSVIYQLNGNVTETADAAWSNDGGGQNVTWENNSPHGGDPTAGYFVTINHTGTYGIRCVMSGSPVVDFGDYRFLNSGNLGGTAFQMSFGNTGTILVHDFIIDGAVTNTGGVNTSVAAGAVVRIANFMIRDCDGNDGLKMGINGCHVENGLITNTDGDGLDNNSKTTAIKNVFCAGNTTDFTNLTSATVSNTASEDATSPDNPSLTPSSEIELDDTISDYGLPLIGGTTIKNGGAAPTYVSNDMNAVAYASYPSNRPICGKILVPVTGGGLLMHPAMDGMAGRYFNSKMNGGLNG